MKRIKIAELRKNDSNELLEMVLALKKDIFAARVSNSKSPSIKYLRRQIARLLTVINEKKVNYM